MDQCGDKCSKKSKHQSHDFWPGKGSAAATKQLAQQQADKNVDQNEAIKIQ